MDVTLFFLLIVMHFNGLTCVKCSRSDGSSVCCYGYVWRLKERKCLPCMDGYIGVNCTTPCPVDYYGKSCISRCNCSTEDCHHVHGCRVIRSSTEELHEQLSLTTGIALMTSIYSEHDTSTISTKATKIPKPSKCPERRKQNGFHATGASVICACLITISASFLIVYIGLHCYIIRHKSAQISSSIAFV